MESADQQKSRNNNKVLMEDLITRSNETRNKLTLVEAGKGRGNVKATM
jgi:hypothetical protein